MSRNTQALFVEHNQIQLNSQKAAIVKKELDSNPRYTVEGLKDRLFKHLTDYLDSRATITRHSIRYRQNLQLDQKLTQEQKHRVSFKTNDLMQDNVLKCLKGFAPVLRNEHAEMTGNESILKTLKQTKTLAQECDKTEKVNYSIFNVSRDRYEYLTTTVSYKEKTLLETHIDSSSFFRNDSLTNQRIELILRLMLDLKLWGQVSDPNAQISSEDQIKQKLNEISSRLQEAIAANEHLNVSSYSQDKNAHHPHVTGSRFKFIEYGGGTFFQSNSDSAIRDCIQMVSTTLKDRENKTAEMKGLLEERINQTDETTKTAAPIPVVGSVVG